MDLIKIFVHLPVSQSLRGNLEKGLAHWQENYLSGKHPERTPYAYHLAEDQGCAVSFSVHPEESGASSLVRRIGTRLLGFDLIHAWRNSARMMNADVIWTHTEREHLAILFMRAFGRKTQPKIIAQSVWLWDLWNDLPGWRRALYRYIMRHADLLTTLSPVNARIASQAVPGVPVSVVHYGISRNVPAPPPTLEAAARTARYPLRVVAVGNDVDRDWETLISAFGSIPDYQVDILTPRVKLVSALATGHDNIFVSRADAAGVINAYQTADVVVVPLRRNNHASGITVMIEAALAGTPMIASDTGGLEDYFPAGSAFYVPPGDPDALRVAVRNCPTHQRWPMAW